MKTALSKVSSPPKVVLLVGFGGLVAGCLLILASQWILSGNGPWAGFVASRVAFSEKEIMAARQSTRGASAALERFLGYGARAEGWKRYLRFNELQQQLADDLPYDQADLGLLTDVVDRLSADHQGLDMPQFVGLRTALSTYIKMLKASGVKAKAA
jgi:hypothetical protein